MYKAELRKIEQIMNRCITANVVQVTSFYTDTTFEFTTCTARVYGFKSNQSFSEKFLREGLAEGILDFSELVLSKFLTGESDRITVECNTGWVCIMRTCLVYSHKYDEAIRISKSM